MDRDCIAGIAGYGLNITNYQFYVLSSFDVWENNFIKKIPRSNDKEINIIVRPFLVYIKNVETLCVFLYLSYNNMKPNFYFGVIKCNAMYLYVSFYYDFYTKLNPLIIELGQ